ncbi:MAG: DUF882 domain-containing protein [Bacteroidales bacterium]|nr:DUF882 domain-containing protein [Bacteroidales bacterium]
MKLSEHFDLREFTHSATAQRQGIANVPGQAEVENLKALCRHVLEPLREHAGQPVIISSGYRSPALNGAVHGAEHSQHMRGEAADIHVPNNDTGNEWLAWMMDHLVFDQLIKERQRRDSPTFWIHVSYRRDGGNRQMVMELVKTKN